MKRQYKEADSLTNLEKAKLSLPIIRQNGLIICGTNSPKYFDTGNPLLPMMDSYIAYTVFRDMSKNPKNIFVVEDDSSKIAIKPSLNFESQNFSLETRLEGISNPISTEKMPIARSEVLELFASNVIFAKKMGYSIPEKEMKEELEKTIEQEQIEAFNRYSRDNKNLQKMLKRSLEFIEAVRRNPLGKVFFGKKIKMLTHERERDE